MFPTKHTKIETFECFEGRDLFCHIFHIKLFLFNMSSMHKEVKWNRMHKSVLSKLQFHRYLFLYLWNIYFQYTIQCIFKCEYVYVSIHLKRIFNIYSNIYVKVNVDLYFSVVWIFAFYCDWMSSKSLTVYIRASFKFKSQSIRSLFN